MIDRSAYRHTGEEILDWLQRDKCWQELADRSQDGNLPEEVRRPARHQWKRRQDDLRGDVVLAAHEGRLKVYLLPKFEVDLSQEGKKIRLALEHFLTNPSARQLPSKSIGLPGIDRKTVDRAKVAFDKIQRWTTSSPTELPSSYLYTSQFPEALYSGDARKLPFKLSDMKATDGTLYFERKAWAAWCSGV